MSATKSITFFFSCTFPQTLLPWRRWGNSPGLGSSSLSPPQGLLFGIISSPPPPSITFYGLLPISIQTYPGLVPKLKNLPPDLHSHISLQQLPAFISVCLCFPISHSFPDSVAINTALHKVTKDRDSWQRLALLIISSSLKHFVSF